MALTLQAKIQWIDNLADFKRQVADGTDALVVHTASVDRLTRSLSGNGLLGAANNYVAAVDKMGGVTRLTGAEQDRINGVLEKAITKYNALGQTAPQAIQDLAAATKRATDATEQHGAAIEHTGGLFSGFISKYLEARAIWDTAREAYRLVTEFIASSIETYANAETAARRLTVAVQTQGFAIPGLADQYRALGMEYQHTTAFSHVAIEGAEALFVQLGNVGPEMMGKAIRAATNLSSGLGIDLNTAVTMLSKAFEGHTTSLNRYGIVLDEARVKTEGMGYVLDAIEGKVGGQAQAELDTYAGKVKQFGNAWDDVKERVGGSIAKDEVLVSVLDGLTDSSDAAAKGGNRLSAAWGAVKAFTPDWLKALVALHDDLADLAVVTNAETDAARRMSQVPPPKVFEIPDLKSQMAAHDAAMRQFAQDQQDAWQKAAEAAKKYAEAVQHVADHITGTDLSKKIHELSDALILVQRAGPLSSAELKRVADEAAKLFHEGATLSPQLLDIAIKFNGLLPAAKVGAEGIGEFGEKITTIALPASLLLQEQIDSLTKKITWGSSGLGELGFKVSDGFAEGAKGIEAANKRAEQSIKDLARAFDQLGSTIGGDMGHAVTSIGHMVTAIESSKKSFGAAKTAFSAGDILGGISSAASGIAGLASAAIDAGKAIVGMWNHFFGTAGRDAVKDFAASMGGFDALQAKLATLGDAGAILWRNLTQGVGRNDPKAAQAAIDAITAALDKQKASADTLLASQNATMGGLLQQLQGLGAGSLLQPYLDKLASAKGLTDDNLAAIKALAGDTTVSFDQMQKAAQALGVSTDSLGHSFQAAKAQADWQSVIDNLDTLRRGGAEMNTLLGDKGLQKKISDLVQQSIKFGTEIPGNMKPWIQGLIDTGGLLDANGDKITDTSKLKFGGDLQTSIQGLIDKIGDLIAKLSSGVPDAIAKIPKTITTTIEFHGRKTGDWPNGTEDPTGADNTPKFHTGTARVLPFPYSSAIVAHNGLLPDEVPAILQTGEAVLNRRAAAALGSHAIGALNHGGGASSGTNRGVETRLDKLHEELRQQRREREIERRFLEITVPTAISAAMHKGAA